LGERETLTGCMYRQRGFKMIRFKAALRPVFSLVFILFFSSLSIVLLYLLVTQRVTLESATAVLITMLGAGGSVTGAYTVARSFEKKNGVSETPPPGFAEN